MCFSRGCLEIEEQTGFCHGAHSHDPIREQNWKTFSGLQDLLGENHSNMNFMTLGCFKMSLEAVILVKGATIGGVCRVLRALFNFCYCKYVNNDSTKKILLKI